MASWGLFIDVRILKSVLCKKVKSAEKFCRLGTVHIGRGKLADSMGTRISNCMLHNLVLVW